MRVPVFLSYPKPHQERQVAFIEGVRGWLEGQNFEARTLGVSDYDTEEPLAAIRRLMLESNGLLTIAFRRTYIQSAEVNHQADLADKDRQTKAIQGVWQTSDYCQIEPAMAYQLGLPIMIFREAGVVDGGLLERGVAGKYMPEFDLDQIGPTYFTSGQWQDVMGKWSGQVRAVVNAKGAPPRLY